jgi:hypothetical protein
MNRPIPHALHFLRNLALCFVLLPLCLSASLASDSYISQYQGSRLYSWDGQYLSKYQGSRLFSWDGKYLSAYQGSRLYSWDGEYISEYQGSRILQKEQLIKAVADIETEIAKALKWPITSVADALTPNPPRGRNAARRPKQPTLPRSRPNRKAGREVSLLLVVPSSLPT